MIGNKKAFSGDWKAFRDEWCRPASPDRFIAIFVLNFPHGKLGQNLAEANLSKHGVSFDEAKAVFDDLLYIDFYDPDHSDAEERYIIVGQSQQHRLLIVAYTERRNRIRLISAREATRMEKNAYGQG